MLAETREKFVSVSVNFKNITLHVSSFNYPYLSRTPYHTYITDKYIHTYIRIVHVCTDIYIQNAVNADSTLLELPMFTSVLCVELLSDPLFILS